MNKKRVTINIYIILISFVLLFIFYNIVGIRITYKTYEGFNESISFSSWRLWNHNHSWGYSYDYIDSFIQLVSPSYSDGTIDLGLRTFVFTSCIKSFMSIIQILLIMLLIWNIFKLIYFSNEGDEKTIQKLDKVTTILLSTLILIFSLFEMSGILELVYTTNFNQKKLEYLKNDNESIPFRFGFESWITIILLPSIGLINFIFPFIKNKSLYNLKIIK